MYIYVDVACNLLNVYLKSFSPGVQKNPITPPPGKCEVMLLSKAWLRGPLPAIYISDYKIQGQDQTSGCQNLANKLSLLKKSKFLPSLVCESFYLKVIQPSVTYALPLEWGSVSQTELFKSLERHHCRAAKIIFGLPLDMPTADVLATVK